MLVYHRVTPSIKFAGNMERSIVRVKCLAQEHNTMCHGQDLNTERLIQRWTYYGNHDATLFYSIEEYCMLYRIKLNNYYALTFLWYYLYFLEKTSVLKKTDGKISYNTWQCIINHSTCCLLQTEDSGLKLKLNVPTARHKQFSKVLAEIRTMPSS